MLAGKRKSTKVTNGRWQIFIFYICLNSAAAAAPVCHSFFNSLCCVCMRMYVFFFPLSLSPSLWQLCRSFSLAAFGFVCYLAAEPEICIVLRKVELTRSGPKIDCI